MVDHHTLLHRLELTFGVSDVALSWFNSHLVGRQQQVRAGRLTSALSMILCAVRQRSVLGRILFLLYTADLLSLIDDCGLQAHLYADDTQLYGFCPPHENLDLHMRISRCIDEVATWMLSNRLQLNANKTEFIWLSPVVESTSYCSNHHFQSGRT